MKVETKSYNSTEFTFVNLKLKPCALYKLDFTYVGCWLVRKYFISCMVFASVHQDMYTEIVSDAIRATGKGDNWIVHRVHTSIYAGKKHIDFIILQLSPKIYIYLTIKMVFIVLHFVNTWVMHNMTCTLKMTPFTHVTSVFHWQI